MLSVRELKVPTTAVEVLTDGKEAIELEFGDDSGLDRGLALFCVDGAAKGLALLEDLRGMVPVGGMLTEGHTDGSLFRGWVAARREGVGPMLFEAGSGAMLLFRDPVACAAYIVRCGLPADPVRASVMPRELFAVAAPREIARH